MDIFALSYVPLISECPSSGANIAEFARWKVFLQLTIFFCSIGIVAGALGKALFLDLG